MMKTFPLLIALLTLGAPLAHAHGEMHDMGATSQSVASSTAQAGALSEGVVRRIDAANGNITLKHGPLANLDMPPMTMVFRAQPPELLNGVKVGDAVKFHAEEIDGTLSVTTIQRAH